VGGWVGGWVLSTDNHGVAKHDCTVYGCMVAAVCVLVPFEPWIGPRSNLHATPASLWYHYMHRRKLTPLLLLPPALRHP
jgi:hypothetical protein